MASLLSVKGVSKLFGALTAVDRVSFDLQPGEVFGIAGPNGAGKTTLFNVITGIPYRATSGEIRFENTVTSRLGAHRICRLGVARTFQRETAFDSQTVYQNVLVASAFGGRNNHPRKARAAAEEALETVGLSDRVGQEARHLPLYDKKLLMIASALAMKPRLLMLDEPGGGLTVSEVADTVSLIQRLNAGGMTILLIEHILPLLLEVSQRVMIMNEGKTLTVGPPDAVVADPRVIEAYLGRRPSLGAPERN